MGVSSVRDNYLSTLTITLAYTFQNMFLSIKLGDPFEFILITYPVRAYIAQALSTTAILVFTRCFDFHRFHGK